MAVAEEKKESRLLCLSKFGVISITTRRGGVAKSSMAAIAISEFFGAC